MKNKTLTIGKKLSNTQKTKIVGGGDAPVIKKKKTTKKI